MYKRQVKEYMPNLVISDIMMPEMRGDELCHILKNDIETSPVSYTHLIGTATGLYLLEKVTGKYSYIQMPVESYYIYSLYQ